MFVSPKKGGLTTTKADLITQCWINLGYKSLMLIIN